jgi:hypothetical protein
VGIGRCNVIIDFQGEEIQIRRPGYTTVYERADVAHRFSVSVTTMEGPVYFTEQHKSLLYRKRVLSKNEPINSPGYYTQANKQINFVGNC